MNAAIIFISVFVIMFGITHVAVERFKKYYKAKDYKVVTSLVDRLEYSNFRIANIQKRLMQHDKDVAMIEKRLEEIAKNLKENLKKLDV